MAQSVADSTGIETIKTLLGYIGVPDFTVDELAQRTGVSRRTVDTAVRRFQHAFERVSSDGKGHRGRPPVRWKLRSDHLDELLAVVESSGSALTGWRAEEAEPAQAELAEGDRAARRGCEALPQSQKWSTRVLQVTSSGLTVHRRKPCLM